VSVIDTEQKLYAVFKYGEGLGSEAADSLKGPKLEIFESGFLQKSDLYE